VNWADLIAAQGAFGTDFYDRSILRLNRRAYYRSGRPIHSAPSLGQSIGGILANPGLPIRQDNTRSSPILLPILT